MIFVRFIPICFNSRIKVVYLRQTDARLNYDELEWRIKTVSFDALERMKAPLARL